MADARALAALIAGVLLALFGALGTGVVLLGALFGVVDMTLVAAVFPLSFVVGVAAAAWGGATVASSVLDGDLRRAVSDAKLTSVWRLLD